jgi:hypothetical protein
MALLAALRSEVLKTKRTSAFYVTLFAAAFGPFMSMLDILLDGVDRDHRADIFNELMTKKYMMTSVVAFPIFLILICTLLHQIEFKNNTWKQVLTSPQRKGTIFLAKFINIQLLILLFLVTNLLLMFVDAVILHFVDPSLGVLHQPLNGYGILLSRATSYVALSAICTAQFWLGLRFRNFIAPVAIGIALWFTGTALVLEAHSDFAHYFPYSFHAYGTFPKYKPEFNSMHWVSVSYAIVFLVIGFLDFRRRRMTA